MKILNINKFFAITITSLCLHLEAASSYQYNSESSKGNVSFRAIGKPAFLKIDGKGEGPKGTLNIDGKTMSASMSFDLKSLTTGIDLRDEHMKDKYLNIKENPVATLQFEKAPLKNEFNSNSELSGPPIQAKLTLNKVTKDINATWESEKEGDAIKVTSKFSIILSDFKIEIPEYAGIKVADEVKIETTSFLSPVRTPLLAR